MVGLEKILPSVQIEGGLFHFSQCNWRKVQEFGLQKMYTEDLAFNEAIRSMTAIACIPSQDVRTAFEELKATLPDEADPMVNNAISYKL